jgi:hypothetical protein
MGWKLGLPRAPIFRLGWTSFGVLIRAAQFTDPMGKGWFMPKMRFLLWMGILALPLSAESQEPFEPTAAIMQQNVMVTAAQTSLGTIGTLDLIKAIISAATGGDSTAIVVPEMPAAVEAFLLFGIAAAAELLKKDLRKALKAQAPSGAAISCPETIAEQCQVLARHNIPHTYNKEICNCEVGIKPQELLNNPKFAEAVPDGLKEKVLNAVDAGDLGSLLDELNQAGGYAYTDISDLSGAVADKLGVLDPAQVAAVLGEFGITGDETGAREESGEEVAFSEDATAVGRKPSSELTSPTGAKPGDPAAENRLSAFKKEWKDAAKKKGSGIIANEKREIFAAVERQYDHQEQIEFSKGLIAKHGRYVDLKIVADETVVKEAVESVPETDKPKSLSDIMRSMEPKENQP